MTSTTAPAPASISITAPTRTPFTIVLVTLIVALIARQVFAIWEHYDGSTTYDELQSFGDALWPMNLFVFGPSFAIGFAAQAILAWQLGRGRGRIVTWVGSALLLVGGVLFSLVTVAHTLPFDWAANHGILDDSTGRSAVEAFDRTGTPVLIPYIVGFQALIGFGALVTVVGARLSRTIPTAMLVVAVAFLLVFFLVPSAPGSPLTIVLSFGQALLWAVIGWFGWRAAGRDRAAFAPVTAD